MVHFSHSGIVNFTLTIIFTIITSSFIILRFVSLRISKRPFFLDDGFILLSHVSPERLPIIHMLRTMSV